MKIEIIKIWAWGTNKRFMWVQFPWGKPQCIRIKETTYEELRQAGVPTSQSLRGKK